MALPFKEYGLFLSKLSNEMRKVRKHGEEKKNLLDNFFTGRLRMLCVLESRFVIIFCNVTADVILKYSDA